MAADSSIRNSEITPLVVSPTDEDIQNSLVLKINDLLVPVQEALTATYARNAKYEVFERAALHAGNRYRREFRLNHFKVIYMDMQKGTNMWARAGMLFKVWMHESYMAETKDAVEHMIRASQKSKSIADLFDSTTHTFTDQYMSGQTNAFSTACWKLCQVLIVMICLVVHSESTADKDMKKLRLQSKVADKILIGLSNAPPLRVMRTLRIPEEERQTMIDEIDADRKADGARIHPGWFAPDVALPTVPWIRSILLLLSDEAMSNRQSLHDSQQVQNSDSKKPAEGTKNKRGKVSIDIMAYYDSFLSNLLSIVHWQIVMAKKINAALLGACITCATSLTTFAFNAYMRGTLDEKLVTLWDHINNATSASKA